MPALANFQIERDDPRTLVVVFLRGAADGLTLVAPVEDDFYHRARPSLAVKKKDAVMLDGFFGLHPNLQPLEAAWKEGDLAIVHGAGGTDDTRSHFEAQDLMEHGGVAAGGWLGRFIRQHGPVRSPLSAVALAPTLPEILSGSPTAAAFQQISEFSLGKSVGPEFPAQLQKLYAQENEGLRNAAQNTFEALRRLASIRADSAPEHGAKYEEDDSFAHGLRQVAQLIKANVGVDAASVDLPGWDTHFTQQPQIKPLMSRLAKGLAAFRADLGPRMATTTVVVLTEFGRRVAENSSFGTDHGRGSAMFVLGGGVRGGRVIGGPASQGARWPGLTPAMLEGPGDLPVWNDYRALLAPVLQRHGATAEAVAKILPGFTGPELNLYG